MTRKSENPLSRIKERDVMTDCKRLLRLLTSARKLHYVRLNVTPMVIGTGRFKRYVPNPEMIGLPDILAWIKNGPCIAIELKRPVGGKLSDGQKEFQQSLEYLGHPYHVVTSMKQLETILASYGCCL